MREAPFPRHGSVKVPIPLDPSGQSSRSLGGWALGAGGGATAATEALGLAAGSSFLASSSQPRRSVASTTADRSFDDWIASDMAAFLHRSLEWERTMRDPSPFSGERLPKWRKCCVLPRAGA